MAGLLGPGSVGAEETQGETLKTQEMEEMVVTATRTEKTLADVPASVSVITQEDLEKQNVKTLDEAIRITPGVYAKRTKGMMDSTSGVNFRGFKGDQYSLVLMDGIPVNDAYTGGLEWGSLPITNVDRIEVVRGPASALYGGNAMGGVINIITKTPEKLEGTATGGYGSNNTYRFRLSGGDLLWKRFFIQGGYEEESTDGWVTTPALKTISKGKSGNTPGGYSMDDQYGNPTKWVIGDKGDNGAFHRAFNFKTGYKLSETGSVTFSMLSGRDEYDYDEPHTYMGTFGSTSTYAQAGPGRRAKFVPNDFIDQTGIGSNETDIYGLTFKETFGPVTLHATGGYVTVDDRYTTESGSGLANYDNSPGTLKITKNDTWYGEISGDIRIAKPHLLTMGVSYRRDSSDTDDYKVPFYRSYSDRGDSTFYSGGQESNWGFFLQEEWRVIDPLTLYLGLRYDLWNLSKGASGAPGKLTDYESQSDSELSPKFAAVWKALEDTTVRGSVGHAFRPPSLYDLYRSWQSGSTYYDSNPNLKPETSWGYELGVEQFLFNRHTRLGVAGFWNDIEDMISYRTEIIDGNTHRVKTNAGKVRTYGLEFEAEQRVTDWLSLWGNYTYTHARVLENETDPESEGKKLTGIPEHMFNLGVDTTYKWAKLSVIGRYFSKIYGSSDNSDIARGVYASYEPAFFLDAKLTVSPVKYMDLFVSVENMLDKHYYEYYRSDGCSVFGGVTFKY